MRILDLPLKAVWYLMIESGEKPEEYREIKEHWIRRLVWIHDYIDDPCVFSEFVNELREPFGYTREELFKEYCAEFAYYSHVRFRYGYTKRTMLFKLNSISIGKGNPALGAPNHEVFILKLGERIK
jgi:hypothetical protein